MDKKTTQKKWILWVVLALTAGLLAGLPILASKREAPSEVQVSIETAQAQKRDVDTILVGGGQLASSGIYSLQIPENVKIQEFLVGNGDMVQEGDTIARVDSVSVMTAITEVQNTLQELSEQIHTADTSTATKTIQAKPSGRVKKIYGKAGNSVEEIMLQYGALAVISLDDTMVVSIEADTNLCPGDKVTVSMGENQVMGRVNTNVNGVVTVTVADEKYPIGMQAEVFTQKGEHIGSGELCVRNGWNVTAYSGTISSVNVKEEQRISANQAIFTVTESGKSAEYQRAIDKRQKYEALMQELFTMYRSGTIQAPCDGIVSGIDTNGAYMLSSTEEPEFRLVLLSNTTTIQISPQDSLPSGMEGNDYAAFFQALQEDNTPVDGTWSITGLPAGLQWDGRGIIYGTPTVSGNFTVTAIFETNGSTYQATPVLRISQQQQIYQGYPSLVTAAGGDAIQVKQSGYSYTISDLNQLPAISPDESSMTVDTSYHGQTIVDGNFAVGDFLWIILDSDNSLVKAVKISSAQKPGNMPQGGMPNTGMPSGSFGGSGSFSDRMPSGLGGTSEDEDSKLYTLDKVTVATITSQKQMTIEITIDELDITKIHVGQTARISMNAFVEDQVDAVVQKIANSGENAGGNSKFTVELELQKSSRMLPGMNATASFLLDTAQNVLCIPAAAVSELERNTVVYTSYDAKTKTLGTPVSVSIGTADADFVQILSGLQEGQTVYYETYKRNSIPAL